MFRVNKNTSKLIYTSRLTKVTSEPVDATPSPVAQNVGNNTEEGDRPVELPEVAGGDASRGSTTPHLLSATQILDVPAVNDGLGGEIGNPDGSDDWDAFLTTIDAGMPSFGGGEAPGAALDDV